MNNYLTCDPKMQIPHSDFVLPENYIYSIDKVQKL